MRNKCKFDGKEISEECDYRKNIEEDKKKLKYFVVGIIVGFLVMFFGIVSKNSFKMGIGLMLMGLVFVLLPFTNLEISTSLGYKRSKVTARIMGIILGIYIVIT